MGTVDFIIIIALGLISIASFIVFLTLDTLNFLFLISNDVGVAIIIYFASEYAFFAFKVAVRFSFFDFKYSLSFGSSIGDTLLFIISTLSEIMSNNATSLYLASRVAIDKPT